MRAIFCFPPLPSRAVEIVGARGVHTSLLPRPNPFTTFPFSCSGKGGSGPASGPVTASRGALGRMVGGREWGMEEAGGGDLPRAGERDLGGWSGWWWGVVWVLYDVWRLLFR